MSSADDILYTNPGQLRQVCDQFPRDAIPARVHFIDNKTMNYVSQSIYLKIYLPYPFYSVLFKRDSDINVVWVGICTYS